MKKKNYTLIYSFKGGSPIRPHVKVGPTATHLARVADCYTFQFSSHFRSRRLWKVRLPSSFTMLMCSIERFIPDEFFVLMTAFMDRGSVTYKKPDYFFFVEKKIFRGHAAGKSVKNASFS
jgi:hypothetical protein